MLPNKKELIFTLFALLFQLRVHAQTAKIIYQKTISSVVTIKTDNATGSGFFISNSLVATNYHVIQGAKNAVIIINSTNESYEVEGYVAKDEVNDLAI